MDDWEDEYIPPLNLKGQPKNKWDDEDVDENDMKESWEDENYVKESWEDEDEPSPAPPPPSAKPIEKAPKKSSEKATGKKVVIEKEEPVDHRAAKLRQQSLVEGADYKSTKELFGNKSDEKNLDNFIPESQSDFLEYAELISHKLRPFEKSHHYMNLLMTVMKLSMTSLKGSEAKAIASSTTSIANEKIKSEKKANTCKKKTGAKKKQLYILTSLMTIWLLIHILIWKIMN